MKRLLLSMILVPSLALAADLATLDGEHYKSVTVGDVNRYEVKNPRGKPRGIHSMISRFRREKSKQASGYRTQRE